MNTYIIIGVIGTLCFLLGIYILFYRSLSQRLRSAEMLIMDIFLEKVAKIPAVIEVMRPYVVDSHMAFDRITELHSESMIREYSSIYMLLEHNLSIHDQYGFLMRLSMAIPELQKHAYFIYIRDFVISHDRMMRSEFARFNHAVRIWNRFILIKNATLLGLLLPGSTKMEI